MNNRRFRWGIREKLTLLFFAVTLIAVTVNFLIVVPRLELRLRNDRVKSTSQSASRLNPSLNTLFEQFDPQLVSPIESVWVQPVSQLSASAGDRIAILKHDPVVTPIGTAHNFKVVYDPTGETRTDGNSTLEDSIASR